MERESKVGFLKRTEWIAIIVVMHYCALRFLESTTFHFEFSKLYRTAILLSLVLVGASRLLFGLWGEYKEKKITKGFVVKLLLIAVSGISSLIVELKFDYTFFLYLVFAAFCLYGIDSNKVLKAFVITISLLLAATILCCLTGVIENYHYLTRGTTRSGLLRSSYGVCYPTDFASYLVFLLLFLWCGGKRKPILPMLGLTALAFYIIYHYANSYSSELCLILLAIFILYEVFEHRFLNKHPMILRITGGAATGIFPLLGILFCGITFLFGQKNSIAIKINTLLHYRFDNPWGFFQQSGIQAFGMATMQNGNGGGDIHRWAENDFLDSTYAHLLIRYGWVLTLVITVLWVWMAWKALTNGNRAVAFAMTIIAVHAFSEHHFPEINYNIILAMPLCKFTGRSEQKKSKKEAYIPYAVGGIAVALCFILLPKVLSWLRTVFNLKSVTAFQAFAVTLFFVLLVSVIVYFLTITICNIISKNKFKRPIVLLTGSICILAALLIYANNTIKTGITTPRITADGAAIQTILSEATESVYVDPIEESYKRKFPGISNHIWTLEEMSRLQKGTIITDREPEAQKLIATGAIYAEISDCSSIYTYDRNVVDALKKQGYICHGFYYTERSLDNASLARLNNLEMTETGAINLKADDKITEEPSLSLYSGTYQVTYIISIDLAQQVAEGPICTLQITANNGDKQLFQKEVTVDELNESGNLEGVYECNFEMSASVRFEVYAHTPLQVQSISWARNVSTDTWRKFDASGRIIEEFYYTADGNPFIQSQGNAGIRYQYEEGNDNWIHIQYLNRDGDLTKINSGYAQSSRVFQDGKVLIEQKYYDEQGIPVCLASGYASYTRTYDKAGNIATESYQDMSGLSVNTVNGYAKIEREYDDNKNIIRQRFLDTEGRLVFTGAGYAEVHRVYDGKNVIREEYYGTDGTAYTQPGGYCAIEQEWNDNTLVSRTYLNADSQPINRTDGYAKAIWEPGEICRSIKFYDVDGNEVRIDTLNLARDIKYGSDGWSDWLIPSYNTVSSWQYIGYLNLGPKADGDVYTSTIEIEFKNVTATEGQVFRFFTNGPQDRKWFTDNVWSYSLINLNEPPEDGVYRYTSTVAVSGDMVNVSNFDIDFRCDYWGSGMYRVRLIKIEKGEHSTDWSPGI